jgi:hypothetical protein
MANTFSLPTHGAPLPDEASPGRMIEAAEWRALTGTINHLHANLGCQPAISQEWAESQCGRTGARADVAVWRIPTLSYDHTLLDCEIRARSAVAPGTVYFTSANTGATATLVVALGAVGYKGPATLNIGTPAAGYDTITMSIASNAGTTTVENVMCLFTEQISPLGVVPVTTPVGSPAVFIPHGEAFAGADYPLPSVAGKQAINNLHNLRARRRVLFCWSGLETGNIDAGVRAKADPFMGPWPHSSVIKVNPSPSFQEVSTYTLWVQVKKQAAATTTVRMMADMGGPEGASMSDPGYNHAPDDANMIIEFAADAGEADEWKSSTFRLRDDIYADGGTFPTLVISIHPGGTGGTFTAPQAASDQRIKSVVLWGE